MFKKLCVMIFIVLFMFCGSVSAGVNDGLVLNYPFIGNANDVSGNGNDGVIYGPILTTDRFGNVDNAYEWDESYDYILKDEMDWNIDKLTISVWFYLETGTDRTQCIISGIKQSDYFYLGYNAAGTFTFRVRTGIGTSGNSWSTINSYTVLNKWTNLIVKWDGNELNSSSRIFVNGFESSINYVYNDTLTPLTIDLIHIGLRFGAENTEGQQFSGKIDDLRIYNRTLSNEEIQQLYTGIFVPTLEDRIIELELLVDGLQLRLENHTHIFTTSDGVGHNTVEAETSVPLQ